MAEEPFAGVRVEHALRDERRQGFVALAAVGSNESNLFLLHVDAKMSAEEKVTC